MHFGFAIGCSLLCASAVLANPVHPPPGTRLPRALPLDNDASYKAGAILSKGNNAIQYVTAAFDIPAVSAFSDNNPGSDVAFWVGIDGVQCDVSLRTGINFTVDDDRSLNYTAWAQWYPDYTQRHTINITALDFGETIELAVTAESTTSGSATIIIRNSAEFHYLELSSNDHPLCQQDAQWIVTSSYVYKQSFLPLANFSQVTFKDAGAAGIDQTYTPADGATVVNIVQNGQTVTSTSIEGSSVTVKYV